MKECYKCKIIKDISLFSKDKNKRDRLSTYCKDCTKIIQKISSKKHYCKESTGVLKRKRNNDSTKIGRERLLLRMAKSRAKIKGLDFNLTLEDIIVPDICPLLEIQLTFNRSKIPEDSVASIDRIDSTKGYIKGNIQIISRLANIMKNKATKEQLLLFSKNILQLNGERNEW